MQVHTHTLLYVYPTGDSVQTGDITNRGQSPIGECVFKQMSPLVGVYKPTHIHNVQLIPVIDDKRFTATETIVSLSLTLQLSLNENRTNRTQRKIHYYSAEVYANNTNPLRFG